MARGRMTAKQLEDQLVSMDIEEATAYMIVYEAKTRGRFYDGDGRFQIRFFAGSGLFYLAVLIPDAQWKEMTRLCRTRETTGRARWRWRPTRCGTPR